MIGSILTSMDLDHVLIHFFVSTAVGAASVLLVILCVGVGMPRRTAATIRRNHR